MIVLGTTGEPAALSPRERAKILSRAISNAKGRVPVIAGVSKNNTVAAITEADVFASIGADALLVITPYCSKATENGLLEHFRMIKSVCGLPIIAYNVPHRTGYELTPELAGILSREGTICGIKQASSSIKHTIDILSETENKCAIFSGEDNLIVPMRSVGAVGAISVLALVMPEVVNALFELPIAKAGKLQVEVKKFVDLLFEEVNPVPIKYLLSLMGVCENTLRLPLSPIKEENARKLKAEAEKLGLLIK